MTGSFEIGPVRTPLPSTRWLTCPRTDPTAPLRLWCLPFAGGGAAIWHPWATHLSGTAEVVALRPPGRENRFAEPPFTRWSDLLPLLVEQIAPYAHEDYALCGYSLGGLLMFELARALRGRGLGSPRALIVCGVRAPHHLPDEPLLHPLPHAQFIAQVEQRYGAIPPEIRDYPDVLDLLLPVLRADLEVYETYRYVPGPPLAIPLLALGGQADPNVSRAALLDWRDYTTGRFHVEFVPGGHFFAQEHLDLTTKLVRDFLRQVCTPVNAATCADDPLLLSPTTHRAPLRPAPPDGSIAADR